MTKNFLLEIGVEELPARFVRSAILQLKVMTESWLKESRLCHEGIKTYATPRRLAVLVANLSEKQKDTSEEVKGPRREFALDEFGKWTMAAVGFAKKQGVKLEELYFRQHGDVDYLYTSKKKKGAETSALLSKVLPHLVTSINFPKSMRWGDHELRYARPIRWLVALFGGDVINFQISNVKSGNVTRGHRFLGKDTLIKEPLLYEDQLKEQYVIADVEERRKAIITGIQSLSSDRGWVIDLNDDLMEEVLFLVEYPTVLAGSFDSSFLNIPQEVLITSMREHQKYFPVLDSEGRLLPHFVTIRNGDIKSLDVIIKGNEKVLRARLADAKFFYEEDKKLVIADAMAKLESIVYHEELGTMADKVRRINKIAVAIAHRLRVENPILIDLNRAAEICKFDLVTQMVSEFPELQGIIGENYASMAGEKASVAQAIREHYMPRKSGDTPPKSLIGAIIGLADKIDTITGCFSIGLVPNGSKDPYALRRQATGIVSILISHEMPLKLSEIFEIALEIHSNCRMRRKAFDVYNDLRDFFSLRVKTALMENGIRNDIIDAVLGTGAEDLRSTILRANVLAAAVTDQDIERLRLTIESFNRVCNIAVNIDSKLVDKRLFNESSEMDLYKCWLIAHKQFVDAVNEYRMDDAFKALSSLSKPIACFFESVMVMDEDEEVRQNRLILITNVAEDINSFADFSKLII
ncbi:glycine--tRNA ligase subunit beta [Paenibacillus sp. 32O-W]|uniref:glycine--tRNA ligase subunit beta n=1 Tax=Paenibacillus sp. 32O-W TaxID=1695218 RepID=UPI0011A829EF|nr:glycine--tRNA ligase subunit beta [Paenibacillus sp. 32O-W]